MFGAYESRHIDSLFMGFGFGFAFYERGDKSGCKLVAGANGVDHFDFRCRQKR